MIASGDINDVGDVADTLIGVFQNPALLIGIPLALLGAVFMSFGAQYQHRGVAKVERLSGGRGEEGLSVGQLRRLVTRPSWVAGTVMLVLAIGCQLAALSYAPLIVVQPLGAIALVITTILNARMTRERPTTQSLRAITMCVGGIFVFVAIAALVATDAPVSDTQLVVILILMAVVTAASVTLWLMFRHRIRALFYIVAAGVEYGFVATLAKVVISRSQSGDFEWLTLLCLAALIAAAALGAYYVQTAYSSGPPDLVIAGLTVIDPMVAILIGLLVLGEASSAPLWALFGFGLAGVVAVFGVFQLARYHPQVAHHSAEVPIERGSAGPAALDADATSTATPGARFDAAVAKVWPEPPVGDRPKRPR